MQSQAGCKRPQKATANPTRERPNNQKIADRGKIALSDEKNASRDDMEGPTTPQAQPAASTTTFCPRITENQPGSSWPGVAGMLKPNQNAPVSRRSNSRPRVSQTSFRQSFFAIPGSNASRQPRFSVAKATCSSRSRRSLLLPSHNQAA